jgi:hypothetical protein
MRGIKKPAIAVFIRLRRAFKSGDPNGIRIARTNDFRTIIGGLEVFHD